MDDIDAELGLGETHRGDLWDDDLEREERVARPALPVKVPSQLQASEIIWKLGTGILQQHPNAKPEDFNCFYERMKHIGVKNYLKICLEHSFHLLANGQLEDAKRQLSVAESWRYGKISASQSQTIRLIQAYRAFLDYFIWQEKKSAISGGDDSDMVWDPFIISYVNMLEFYGDQEGALSVLKEYAYDSRFPSNPNAHVYLYQHLRKHLAPNRKLISVLQILHSLLPCHELMLELCDLLLQTAEEESLQEALTVIFSLLDYSGWKSSLEAWSGLRDVLRQLKRMKLRRLSAVEWGNRAPWWPAYHFSTYHARRDLELRPALAEVKSSVAAALMGSDCSYCRKRKNLLAEDRAKKHKALLMKPRKRKR
ncbi:hypothetical protein COCON_G00099850 [Conger conger]|uniref:TATA box-binding protein-associated factor RNA polymerase I subunit A n=1 Tax=Conger conger TaxID=82655 RepID=A0A9Q1I1S2_CONCO|nr:hypothetical protein COCON_G00099850 [Conger conger]